MFTTSQKTKIVATIGPRSESKEAFRALVRAGISVARTNMSHDDQTIHGARIKTIRAVAKQEGAPIAILQDLSGPKIRIGDFEGGSVELVAGAKLVLTGKKCVGSAERVHFNYPYIKKDIKAGMTLMLDDGKKRVRVDRVIGTDIHTTVEVGGMTKSRRGVNIPGAYLSIKALTDKDRDDLAFGIKAGVDFVALSFVRTARDVEELRALIHAHKGHQLIVSKIETQEAIEQIDAIIEASDAVMVARGDLAVEVGPAKVPTYQKMIIRKCNAVGKPVIVATQMLESMITSPVPTRAEVSDVANAIHDGADAVMLSEETTLGAFAVEAVGVMGMVAREVESDIGTHRRHKVAANNIVDSISSSVVHNAEDLGAAAIAAFTRSGFTARMIARYKPTQPIVALTSSDEIVRQLMLSYGCYPIKVPRFKDVGAVVEAIPELLRKAGFAKRGDAIVLSTGTPVHKPVNTNSLFILTV